MSRRAEAFGEGGRPLRTGDFRDDILQERCGGGAVDSAMV
jgi:hypothetical protein